MPGGTSRSLVVDDARLEAAGRAAEGARADLARLVAVGEDAPGLGHAPHLDQREAEALLERRVQLRLDAGADAEAHRCARSSGAGGWLSSIGGMTPR